MEIAPIAKTLLRNRVGPLLLMLQVAVTLAFLANAFYIVGDRIGQMSRPIGVDTENLFRINVTGLDETYESASALPADLEAVRRVDGVRAVTTTNSVPLGGSGYFNSVSTSPDSDTDDGFDAALYMLGETSLEALGAELYDGRWFRRGEIQTVIPGFQLPAPVAVLTRALAERLFPDASAVGQTVYIPNSGPTRVIGVVDFLGTPWSSYGEYGSSILLPIVDAGPVTQFLVRSDPGMRDKAMADVEQALVERDPNRLVHRLESLEQIVARAYEDHKAMSIILITVGALLLVVNVLGIVGLASFQVNRRRRQIGTRRALGASRMAVQRYFMTEIGIIVGLGLAVGLALTIVVNYGMMRLLDFQRLDLTWLPLAAGLLFLLGQLAVLGPARRAAFIPPAEATRSS